MDFRDGPRAVRVSARMDYGPQDKLYRGILLSASM